MQRIEYMNPKLDRADWPGGPWDLEPDKIQWQDKKTGLPCLIVRNHFGGLCGYVGVPHDHPFYEKDYKEVNDAGAPAHGGLTYANKCIDGPEDQTVCHLVEPGEDDDTWWLGFDCGHFMDVQPRMLAIEQQFEMNLMPGSTYKTVGYVEEHVRILARWLSKQRRKE